ncbi:MAG TPA: 4-hydroxy-tetrahydrodipicolinate synthase [Coxiellaceae bacterium]|nr:4-hydroxy-tetrahydrodipicolinate synthase [Coxiellaceae bacterium]
MFQGNLVALVTPMRPTGELDFAALERLIEWHIAEGTDGLVLIGTTGESPTINDEERKALLAFSIAQVRGRIPVIVGTGTNSTSSTISYTRAALEARADACLLVTPYYNKPTQEGLYQHYRAIAKAVAIPQILYNVPGRTVCDLLPETAARIAKECSNVVAVKEATNKIERVAEYKALDAKLDLLSGDDASEMEFMLAGGQGVISVTANIAPRLMTELCRAALAGDRTKAQAINQRLSKLHNDLFVEANPIAVKWLLADMGLIQAGLRLPLTPLSEQYHARLREALAAVDGV